MYLHFTNALFASVERIQTNKQKTKPKAQPQSLKLYIRSRNGQILHA